MLVKGLYVDPFKKFDASPQLTSLETSFQTLVDPSPYTKWCTNKPQANMKSQDTS
jgi:hypothetical protein